MVATNKNAEHNPHTVGSDPYGRGWLATIWPVEHNEALKNLTVGDRAATWQEHYISPKETNGVLMTIATIKKKPVLEPEVCSDDFAMEIGGGKK